MKKRWISLATLLVLLLVLMPTTAMATAMRGLQFCTTCQALKIFTVVGYRSCESNGHALIYKCMGCKTEISGEVESHTGGGATCTTEGTCNKCGASYKDPNNHGGNSTDYRYRRISETEHNVTVVCKGCKKTINTYNEGHREYSPAKCCYGAMCANCWTYYGSIDPNNHVGETSTTYVKTSETQHTEKITYADCRHAVDGESTDHTPTTAATCTTGAYCKICESYYGEPDSNAHDLESHDGQAPTCTAVGWDAYETCQREGCDYTTYVEKPALGHHFVADAAVAPTCTKTGLTAGTHCDRCGAIGTAQEIVPKTEHNYDKGVVTKPTCSAEGYTTYTCKDCGYKLVTDKVKPLSHWYDLWEPTGDGRNSAPCKRSGCTYTKTTACVDWDFMLVPAGSEEAEGFTICPVCGAMSDGGRLELVESAVATPVVYWTPEGDLLVRWGTMENGETIMCVGFEFDARLAQCYGSINFTVPAELLEGYRLMLLDAEGNETEMEVEIVGQKATFLVNFSADAQSRRTPVRMFHLVPLESEGTVEATEAEETAGK